jgi:hypothetical protein
MRMFEAEPEVIRDFKDETEVIGVREHKAFRVTTARHPTLGKVVIVEGTDGAGVIVATEE